MKIISVTILLLISFQIYSQDLIIREFDVGVLKYRYQERFIEREDVKDLIVNTQDSLAKKYLSRSIIRRTTGPIIILAGAFLIYEGARAVIVLDDGFGTLGILFGVPIVGIGILIYNSGNNQFKKSIEQFNSLQQSNLKVDINRNGIGLRYNF